ncbi:hypothetical protein LAG90_14100 [Marinilongibacter aquaticus]|uniref:hypothetical protein n=1 Tax=Marinilongibacter aquaticus TaxID=2975157 RepID=UPI0021BD967D|nr:hypothetical protein [Marinilongibacter aquaticus]UBM57937.1 hypothetical protein LAG90_14100 [Marinilongibacter aquaticus]
MKSRTLIWVEIKYNHEQISIKGSEASVSYYSNLSLAMEALLQQLALQGWDTAGFNYTAVYRAIQLKNAYTKRFTHKGTAFFQVHISKVELNPKLDTFGIEPCPE